MAKVSNYKLREDFIIDSVIQAKWEKLLDLIAELMAIPVALIMRAHPWNIEVFAKSGNKENIYRQGERAPLHTGLYCEYVMDNQKELVISNALKEPEWKDNPDIALGMIAYMGYPILWPTGEVFGTICVLDTSTKRSKCSAQRMRGSFWANTSPIS